MPSSLAQIYQPIHRAILSGSCAQKIKRIIRTDPCNETARSVITDEYEWDGPRCIDADDPSWVSKIGETALHMLVYKVFYDDRNDMADAMRELVEAHPAACEIVDEQGDSPFMLTISSSSGKPTITNNLVHNDNTREQSKAQTVCAKRFRTERLIRDTIEIMVQAHPNAAKVPCEWENMPLHHALMCNREVQTVRIIVAANPDACSHRNFRGELPLHIAVKYSAPLEVIVSLLETYPLAANTQDGQGFTPLHWAWVRHVSPNQEKDGRIVPMNFAELAATSLDIIEQAKSPKILLDFLKSSQDKGLFWETTKLLLRYATATEQTKNADKKWRVVHAASSVCCPRATLRVAIKLHPEQIMEKDENGRIPLHLAAACPAFTPWQFQGLLGQPCGPDMLEESAIDCILHHHKTDSFDNHGRIALHIAIESEKKVGRELWGTGVRSIICANPDAYRLKDCVTGLYPFMLAVSREGYAANNESKKTEIPENGLQTEVMLCNIHNIDRNRCGCYNEMFFRSSNDTRSKKLKPSLTEEGNNTHFVTRFNSGITHFAFEDENDSISIASCDMVDDLLFESFSNERDVIDTILKGGTSIEIDSPVSLSSLTTCFELLCECPELVKLGIPNNDNSSGQKLNIKKRRYHFE